MTSKAVTLEINKQFAYGAPEIKEWIKKNTVRAFIYTISAFLLLLLINFLLALFSPKVVVEKKSANIINVQALMSQAPTEEKEEEEAPPPDVEKVQITFGTGFAAGTAVAVPDAITDLPEYASFEQIDKSNAEGTEGNVNFDQLPDNYNLDQTQELNVDKGVVEEDPYRFIPVEKEPYIELSEIQKRIEYPETARRAGVEGKVTLRVKVGKDGRVIKTIVEDSPSSMLNEAAIKAVKEVVFTPAIQNGEPVECWVSIPINFKLR